LRGQGWELSSNSKSGYEIAQETNTTAPISLVTLAGVCWRYYLACSNKL